MKKLFFLTFLLLIFVFFLSADDQQAAAFKADTIDIGPKLRQADLPVENLEKMRSSVSMLRALTEAESEYYEVGAVIRWLALDNYEGMYFWADYELKAMSDTSELWVQVDMSYPENDPRETPVVSVAQAEYMLGEFDLNIVPKEHQFFGVPNVHDGTNGYFPDDYSGSSRNVILVSNVRDDQYYDHEYPYYIAGFYSPTYESVLDRNIITIDGKEWGIRIGNNPDHPFLYESVVAHEFQHLIHSDYNPNDDIFMNEGCSMFSEIVCGYPEDWPKINSFLATPDNSLVAWSDQGGINILADYGAAYLWTIYLNDHYGGPAFVTHFVQSGVPGVDGLNQTLAHFGYDTDFDRVFHDWQLTNLIQADYPGQGKYNYKTISLKHSEVQGLRTYNINKKQVKNMSGADFGNTITLIDNDTGIVNVSGYGTDYIRFKRLEEESVLKFDGLDNIILPTWIREDQDSDGDLEWYSTPAVPEANRLILAKADLSALIQPVLNLDTYFDIEEKWDYAFVQISTDDGLTWTSLANEYTTMEHDPQAYPGIIASLPGLTGSSGEWTNMSFDLTPYVGQEVILGFRYMTDWGTEFPGWWIDNIKINETLIDNADDVNAFYFPETPEADFLVTLVTAEKDDDRGEIKFKKIKTLKLNDLNEKGRKNLEKILDDDKELYLLVTPLNGSGDYSFSIREND